VIVIDASALLEVLLGKKFSASAAAYVALAELLEARLLTHDRHLAAAARRHATVELV
jgi:predicted nucleic acid-binding protein